VNPDKTKNSKVFSINYSKEKNVMKTTLTKAELIEGFGIKDDARGGSELKQISLLAIESIKGQGECPKAKRKGASFGPGDFSENITTEGLDLAQLKIGDRLKIGARIILEISKIGKQCYKYCDIYSKIEDCVIPREAMFAKVLKGGEIAIGDNIETGGDI